MFYLQYLKAELLRRWSKTLTISLGLAIAGAIIIAIISVSQSLSTAQKTVLNPLENVGTDVMVSRSVGAEGARQLDEATRTEFLADNKIETDLSKYGNPGDQFSHDNFLSGSMLTFADTETKKIDANLIKDYASGLILSVTHQEGKIPKVTAEFETGGDKIQINRATEPMTDTERAAADAARQNAEADLKAKGIDPRSEEGRKAVHDASDAVIPERFKNFKMEYTTERKTYSQDIGPIATDIKTENFTVAGVDTSKPNIGLILPDQIVNGQYFNGADQIVVNRSYADKKSLQTDGKLSLGGKEFTVIGIVEPKLYTNTADLYLPLSDLQKLAGKDSRINVLLLKSTNSYSVEEASKKIAELFPGTKVTNSSDTAAQVSGSLVSAANLTNKFIGITSIIVVIASFIIVSLLTVLSVNKRVREIGTLKAIGWSNTSVIRQILLENTMLGILGAIIGIGFGLSIIVILNRFGISLSATIASMSSEGGLMRRFAGNATNNLTTSVELKVAINYLILLLGAGVAIIGSILAGGLAAFKASRMKPQEALRNLE